MKTLELCRVGKFFRGKAYSAHLLYSQCLSRITLSLSLTHSKQTLYECNGFCCHDGETLSIRIPIPVERVRNMVRRFGSVHFFHSLRSEDDHIARVTIGSILNEQ